MYFHCEKCGASLRSNLRWVAFVEGLVGFPILILLDFGLRKIPVFSSWSSEQVMLLLLLPALLIHIFDISKFVTLRKVDA